MDALEASLRVVLAHVRQVEIKIVEGVWGGVCLGNFNVLQKKKTEKDLKTTCAQKII